MTDLPFQTSLDIANRACQHCGVKRITSAALSIQDGSQQQQEFYFNYDKLRDAELRRNTWAFSTKLAALRPINSATFLFVPNLWSAAISYGPGAIVLDPSGNGVIWQSSALNNLNNTPGASLQWDVFFGSLCVNPFNPPASSGFSTGPAWSATTTYSLGAVVADVIGNLWASQINNNLNNMPGSSIAWVQQSAVTGSVAQNPPTYFAGELVYTTNNAGSTYIFASLTNGNVAVPTTASAWSSSTTYVRGNVVSYGGYTFMSMFDLNIGQTPPLYNGSGLPWQVGITYAANATVMGIDGIIYYSLAGSNVGHDPTTTTGFWGTYGARSPWAPNFTTSTVSSQWQKQYGTLAQINLTYPIGTGPSDQTTTRNVFMLPNGYLRKCPQDPKRGSVSYLGAPSGLPYDDWEIQDGYIVSSTYSYIMLRFIADVTQVPKMDPMFCEGLAARLALESVERLTQSEGKKAQIERDYKQFMGEARTVDGIETGAVEPPEDDYIQCRI